MAETTLDAQLNIRMPGRLKREGDAALREAGLNPSTLVRAVWTKASRRGSDLAELQDLVAQAEGTGEGEAQRRRALIERSPHIVDDVLARYGLRLDEERYIPLSGEEVENALYEDFLAEGSEEPL